MVYTRLAIPIIIPVIILAIAVGLRTKVSLLPENYLPLLGYAPYVLLIVSGFLCFQFNQFRSLLIAIILSVCYFIIQFYLQESLQEIAASNIYFLLSGFLPLMFILISWIPERGIITTFGILFLTISSLPVMLAIYLYLNPTLLVSILEYFPIREWTFSVLSPLAIIIYLLTLTHQIVRLWKYQQPFDAVVSILILSLLINFSLFDKDDMSIVIFIAAQLIIIWGILKQTHDMAYRDELTGLQGRRALNEALKSPGRKYVLAMMDIDHFKKFNDKYGHDVGDDVLKIVANKIAMVTGGGKAYRYGGEEFTVLFKGKELEPCIPHLQAVREEIARYSLSIREKASRPKTVKEGKKQRTNTRKPKGISVTISIGVAKRTTDLSSPELILKAADKALYKAKKAGRNCLVVN